MAADKVAVRKGSGTLTADTAFIVNLTGANKPWAEVAHHNDAPEVIWVTSAASEAALPDPGDAEAFLDEWDCVLPGERLPVETIRGEAWVMLLSEGIPSFTVSAVR